MKSAVLVLCIAFVLTFIEGGEARAASCVVGQEKMRGCLLCRCLLNGRESCMRTSQCSPIRSPNLGACVPGTVENTKCRRCVCTSDRVYQCERVCQFEVHHIHSGLPTRIDLQQKFREEPHEEMSQKEVIFVHD